jgi:Tetratricopeptide repeat/TIR domain/NB-ARC domain
MLLREAIIVPAKYARRKRAISRKTLINAVTAGIAALTGIIAAALHSLAALIAGGTVAVAGAVVGVIANAPTGAPRNQVVVSHSQGDLRWARWIAQSLNAAGYFAILQTFDIYPASDEQLRSRARNTLADACCLLFLVTDRMLDADKAAETSRWTAALAAVDGSRKVTALVLADAGHPEGADQRLEQVPIAHLNGPTTWSVIFQAVRARSVDFDSARANRFTGLITQFPGDGPEAANLPEVNPNFTGRKRELAGLHHRLVETTGPVDRRTVALTAMSGMGKTQIAAAFVHEFKAEFDVVWWINAQRSSTLYSDLEALAHRLDITERPDQQEMLRLLWERLREHEGHWLLVYDSAADPTKLRGLVPFDGDGSVLITSQNADWSQSVTHSIELEPMTEQDALELLRHRTGSPDPADLTAIARRLGYLPLALEQAASYMRESACSASHYLSQLEVRIDDLLERGAPLYYDQVAKTTFLMARERAAELEPLSGVLLELLSLLAADAIPRDLFEAPQQNPYLPAALAGAITQGLRYDAAIRAVRTYSLINVNVNVNHFAMHRLVQELIRRSLPPTRLHERAESVLSLLANAFPDDPDDVSTWDRCAELLSHATSVLDVPGIDSATAARLARRVGEYLRVRGVFGAAHGRLSFALNIQSDTAEPDLPELAATLLAIARTRFRQARLAAAQMAAEEALSLHEQVFGPDSERVAVVLDELCQIQLELSDLHSARTAAERSLQIRQLGHADDARLGRSHEYLGLVLWRQGDWPGAYEQHTRALALISILGPEHGSVGRTHTHLGLVLRDTAGDDESRLLQAEREFALAEHIMVTFFGPDHPDTASAGVHHADILRRRAQLKAQRGNHDEANRLRAIAAEDMARIMAGRAMTGLHPGRACGLVRHAHLLNNLGEPVTARAKATEALAIYIHHYGRDHPYVAETLTRLSAIEYALRDTEEAIRNMEEARRIYVHAYGPNHPYVAQADACLANPTEEGFDY